MSERGEPRAPRTVRDEIIGLGSRSLRKSYFGSMQRSVADAARFRALLDDASDAIVVAELPSFRIVDANQTARGLLDTSGADPHGRLLPTFFPRPAWRRVQRHLRERSGLGTGTPVLLRVGGRAGTEWEIALRDEALGSVRYLVLVARDVTERRRGLRAMKDAKRAAEALARAKSDFLSIASHELRTPLTTLKLRLQHAARSDPPGVVVRSLLGPLQRLTEIVNHLVDVARLGGDRPSVKVVATDLRALVLVQLHEHRSVPPDRTVRIHASAPVLAWADPDRVFQILGNLLDNAVKYSPPGSPIDVRVACDGGRATVTVADRGRGIPSGMGEAVFTPFNRLPTVRTIPGLGLGLYLARQLARAQGGNLTVDETRGGGATFTLSLTRADHVAEPHPAGW